MAAPLTERDAELVRAATRVRLAIELLLDVQFPSGIEKNCQWTDALQVLILRRTELEARIAERQKEAT